MTQADDAATWWYEKTGQRQGPVTLAELQALVRSGGLGPTTLVWTAGMAQWAAAGGVPALAGCMPAEPPPLPPGPAAPPQPAARDDTVTQAMLDDVDFAELLAPPRFGLAADVRKKYVAKLAERHQGWAGFLGLIAWGVALRSLDIASWPARLVLLVLLTGGAVALAEHWQTQRLQGLSDALIEKEYDETLAREKQSKLVSSMAWIVGIAVVVLVLALNDRLRSKLGTVLGRLSSAANCAVEQTHSSPSTFVVNGSPDFGYVVRGTLANTGQAGDIEVSATLQTPEGDFKRSEHMHLAAGEKRTISFDFHEPTVASAGEGKYSVTCSP